MFVRSIVFVSVFLCYNFTAVAQMSLMPEWAADSLPQFASPAPFSLKITKEEGITGRFLEADTTDKAANGRFMEVLSATVEVQRDADGSPALVLKGEAISFFDSTVFFPSLLIELQNNTTLETLRTARKELFIESLPIDTTADYRDIKDILDVPVTIGEYLPHTLIVVGILAIAGGIWWWVRRRSSDEGGEVVTKEPTVAPHIEATEALLALEKEGLWQQDKTKEYYTRLTEIIRRYCERRYRFEGQDRPTEEFLSMIAAYSPPSEAAEELAFLLRLADLVKFAKAKTVGEENIQALQWALRFVEKTKAAPLQETAKEGGNTNV